MATSGNSSYVTLQGGEVIIISEREAKRVSDVLQGNNEPPEFMIIKQKWGGNDVGVHLIRVNAIDHVFHLGSGAARKPRIRKI